MQKLGNEAWRSRGEEKRKEILDYVSKKPYQSLYSIAKDLKTSASNIKHHVEILEAEGKISKNIQILGNKVQLSYFLEGSESYKFYINGDIIEQLKWDKKTTLQLYIVTKDFMVVIDTILHSYETKSLMRITLQLHKDEKGAFIIIPKNIKEFFTLELLDREENQTLMFDPREHVIIHLR